MPTTQNPEPSTQNLSLQTLTSLCRRRGFLFQSSEIYGGLASTWDYGPLGVELKNNVKRHWWQTFVWGRRDMVGLDAAILMHPEVWRASGHVENFTDPLVDCRSCRQRFRADNLEGDACPNCGETGTFTEARQFNLMFETHMGPVQTDENKVHLRPETAQGIFVNFDNVLNTTRRKLPFGIAQIGKTFRNEITTGNFIFRTREFEIMEIEFFVKPGEDEEWHQEVDRRLHGMVHRPRRRPRTPATPPPRVRRARPLRQGHLRYRVPLPLGLGRDSGHRQPYRLRPQGPLRRQRRVPHLLRRAGQGALHPLRHRAFRRRRPRRHDLPRRRLHRRGDHSAPRANPKRASSSSSIPPSRPSRSPSSHSAATSASSQRPTASTTSSASPASSTASPSTTTPRASDAATAARTRSAHPSASPSTSTPSTTRPSPSATATPCPKSASPSMGLSPSCAVNSRDELGADSAGDTNKGFRHTRKPMSKCTLCHEGAYQDTTGRLHCPSR